jgi:hypothetical protein
MVKPEMSFGIASALTEHDRAGPNGIMYHSDGEMRDPTKSKRRKGFSLSSKGTVLGCAVDIKNRIAVFTCDGKIIGNPSIPPTYSWAELTPEKKRPAAM